MAYSIEVTAQESNLPDVIVEKHAPPRIESASYNREAARNYADTWCRGRNPTYNCGYAYDCQNFLSQVLNAGHLPQLKCGNPWNWSCWWFTSCNDVSRSWYNVPAFDAHAQYWNGARFSLRSSLYYLGVGDPIISRRAHISNWEHAAVYMGYGIAQEGTKQGQFTQLRSQHTIDRCRVWVWDYYEAGTQFRLWNVTW
ncbi:MAG: amidase domain-containing protein [Anaerolineae bacterium]